MPSITISTEQAAALARGENVTIEPEREELHNVLFKTQDKAMYFVWDGYVLGNKIYATRWQRVANVFGEPVHEPTKTHKAFIAERQFVRGGFVQVGA